MTSIAFRDPFGGLMKFLAEFITILGVFIVLKIKKPTNKRLKIVAAGSGILMRVLIMSVVNVLLLPLFYQSYTFEAIVLLLPLIGIFNVIQGVISIFGGFLFYEAIVLRFRTD
jgi:riboflavin transporter FmnP